MKIFRVTGHTEDQDGWRGEPIVVVYTSTSARDAVSRFKSEVALIVRNVECLGDAKPDAVGGALLLA